MPALPMGGNVQLWSFVNSAAPPSLASWLILAVHTSCGDRKRLKLLTSRPFMPSLTCTLTTEPRSPVLTTEISVS